MHIRSIAACLIALAAGAAIAQVISTAPGQKYEGSAASKNSAIITGIATHLNAVNVQAETAYRRGTPYDAKQVFIKGDVQDAINKVVGSRVNMLAQINSITGKTVVSTVPVRTKPLRTKIEEDQVDSLEKKLADFKKNPLPKSTDVEGTRRWNADFDRYKNDISNAARKADANAKKRNVDATVNIEFDALPPNARPGIKIPVTGWIKNVKVEPVSIETIPFAKITMTIQYENMREPVTAATQPENPSPASNDSLGSQLTDAPATQPKPMIIGDAAAPATQPAE